MDSVIVVKCQKQSRNIHIMEIKKLGITKDLDIMRQREKWEASKIALRIHTEVWKLEDQVGRRNPEFSFVHDFKNVLRLLKRKNPVKSRVYGPEHEIKLLVLYIWR